MSPLTEGSFIMNSSNMPTARAMWLGVVLATASALAVVGLLQAAHPMYVVPSKYDIGMGASEEARLQLLSQTQLADGKNDMVIFTAAGALLGCSLAMVACSCCGLPLRIGSGLVWGGLWGLITGLVASKAALLIMPVGSFPSVTSTGTAQGLAFGLLGAGIGLMYGGFTKNAKFVVSAVIGGLLAGAGGGFAFAMLVGFVAQFQNGSKLIPLGLVAQLIWLVLPFAAIGYALPKSTERERSTSKKSSDSTRDESPLTNS